MDAARPGTIVFTIGGPIGRSDLPALCRRLLVEAGDAGVALCDVDDLVAADAVAVDALARLQLTARRIGCCIRLRAASAELRQLLAFVGLDGVVGACGLRLEPGGQAEQREQLLGAEEEGELGDPTA